LIGFRPKPSALFLERPRLLSILPEESGYIVWLEAPYGYGKSVLVSQWAAQLDREARRVIWLALVDGDPRRPLAMVLGLSENAAWSLVLEGLAQEKTLVILEDLENDPESGASLGPLLKHNPGLVLLASRKSLHAPELPRARAPGLHPRRGREPLRRSGLEPRLGSHPRLVVATAHGGPDRRNAR
jgi:hypothetical protein